MASNDRTVGEAAGSTTSLYVAKAAEQLAEDLDLLDAGPGTLYNKNAVPMAQQFLTARREIRQEIEAELQRLQERAQWVGLELTWSLNEDQSR